MDVSLESKRKVVQVSQSLFSPRIRIEKVVLQNFKGVKNGVIEFNCLKTPTEKDTCSDIIGIYGQNGSGKTTLLEALHIAKLAMMGEKIPLKKYGNIISQDSDSARMTISFQVSNSDGSFYHLEYAFSLGFWEIADSTSKDDRKTKNLIKSASNAITASAVTTSAITTALGITSSAVSVSTATSALATALGITGASIMMPGIALVGAAGIVASQILKSTGSEKEALKTEGKVKRIAIFDEVLSLSGMFNGSMVRSGPIFDTRTTETAFLPKARHKSFFPVKTTAVLKELQKYKSKALINAKSFIFSDELSQLLLDQGSITEYAQIILNLKAFAIQKIRILDSRDTSNSSSDTIPLYTANHCINLRKKDSTIFLDEEGLQTLKTAIKGLNVVLQQVIPGLSLKAVRQVDIDIEDRNVRAHATGTKVTVYSVRDNVRIPLAEESAGIIRLISSMNLFAYAFVNPDVTVAIDEIDAGVYEYLLGELLLIFEEYGSGQLIFTCHNLRPMEVLNKKYICFTTTNPENRYLKPKSIRNENNLRDVYLREIVMGGQDEELYSTAKHGKIASALQKAGEIIGQE